MGVHDCRLIDLPVFVDSRGALMVAEGESTVPFAIRRMYYLFDIRAEASRGDHAHYRLQQILVALTGRLDIELDDGKESKIVSLAGPSQGLYIGPMIWRRLVGFDPTTIVAVHASLSYDPNDYIRNYDDFKRAVAARRGPK